MTCWVNFVPILAQEAAKEPPFWVTMLPFLLIFALLFPIVVWPQRREQQKRDSLISSLKKNDRVVTIGGIIGSIANISTDGKEITLKVDDNTRIKFTRSAISHKLDESKEDSGKPAT